MNCNYDISCYYAQARVMVRGHVYGGKPQIHVYCHWLSI